MPSDQEKQQMFQMLAQGLLQHLMPTFQQVAQNVVQQGLRAGAQAAPNHWNTPITVQRTADEDSPNEFEALQTTPAQLLAEACDHLSDISAEMADLNERLRKGKGRRRT